ncbi:acylphosphatase [Xanthomonadaceae bacterium JHOS43]|nr:acylphosphatase [Xanthomonadaceae bacterium JHOS43]MCX7563379.1 acylphosphatase [Xanthomonadaceae bacterium XH05]
MNAAARFFVAGRVQGVFYRASTRSRAQALGLRGHAHNLPDGRVEVLAVGAADAIDVLEEWLWDGPVHAVVTAVSRESATVDEAGEGFALG